MARAQRPHHGRLEKKEGRTRAPSSILILFSVTLSLSIAFVKKVHDQFSNPRASEGPPSSPASRSPRHAQDPRLCILLGAQKAGTESLSLYLERHSNVTKSYVYEPHYFTKNSRWSVDPPPSASAYLAEVFPPAPPGATYFEKTPKSLFRAHEVAPRLRAAVPDARLLVSLRDPVERAFSHYKMVWRTSPYHRAHGLDFARSVRRELAALRATGLVEHVGRMRVAWEEGGRPRAASLAEVWDEETLDETEARWEAYLDALREEQIRGGIVGRGLYFAQLCYFFRAFEGRNMEETLLPLKAEDMLPDARGDVPLLDEVTRFLHLSPLPRGTNDTFEKHHVTSDVDVPRMTDETRRELRELYAPFNSLLGVFWGKEWDSPWN